MRFPAVGEKCHGSIGQNRYDVVLIGIDKSGKWHWHQGSMNLIMKMTRN